MKMPHKLTRDQKKLRTALIMLTPAIIFLALMIAFPLGKVIHDAFNHVHLINKSMTGFAGLDNFKTVVSDEHFGQAVKNSILWTIFSVLGEYILGLTTAVLLNQKLRGRAIFRTFIFIPWLAFKSRVWDYQLYTDKSEYSRYTYQLSGRFQICSGYGYFCKYMEKFSILYDFFSFSHAVYTRRSGRGSRYRRSRDFQKVFQRYPSPAPFSISGDRFYTCDLDGCKL